MYSNNHVVNYEPSKSIPIKQNISRPVETPEYGLKQNFFDPSKSSPPNEFMLKLRLRTSLYTSVDRNLTDRNLTDRNNSMVLGQKC